ncbi:hypothetical protein T492DRAFT_888691 [Pavlovales sp. CCMP2436]|nr:hypothetical protein T492DRAFT_888691 [Pavlovales sp. CCMP2436]
MACFTLRVVFRRGAPAGGAPACSARRVSLSKLHFVPACLTVPTGILDLLGAPSRRKKKCALAALARPASRAEASKLGDMAEDGTISKENCWRIFNYDKRSQFRTGQQTTSSTNENFRDEKGYPTSKSLEEKHMAARIAELTREARCQLSAASVNLSQSGNDNQLAEVEQLVGITAAKTDKFKQADGILNGLHAAAPALTAVMSVPLPSIEDEDAFVFSRVMAKEAGDKKRVGVGTFDGEQAEKEKLAGKAERLASKCEDKLKAFFDCRARAVANGPFKTALVSKALLPAGADGRDRGQDTRRARCETCSEFPADVAALARAVLRNGRPSTAGMQPTVALH